jgi:alpha-galactosidase
MLEIGAAAKSPLIMGNDLRIIKPADLSILSNAAVIAINQDPAGSSASRRYINWVSGTPYVGPSLQMWSGSLTSTTGGDQFDVVVLLINGNNQTELMNATLADIFVDYGAAGTAAQVKMSWEVRDLWAGRMSNEEAQSILDAASALKNVTISNNATQVVVGRYNATEMSYEEGLKEGNEILLGNVTTTVMPSGTVTAKVASHGAAMFRLRAVPTGMRKRDEL